MIPGLKPCWRAVAVAALALLAAGGIAGGRAEAAARKAIWGPSIRNGVSLFPSYHDLGVELYEDDVHWDSIATRRPSDPRNPDDPAYVWPVEVTRSVAEAAHFHMRVALQIVGAPPWANGGKPWNWSPSSPRDYADFAVAAAKRYPSVRLWMIWGEPSRSHNYSPLDPAKPFAKLDVHQRSAPHRYAKMLDAAYGALKRVRASNVVIGGMTYTTGNVSTAQWIENLKLPNGKPPRLDMYGHNPFGFREPSLANPPGPQQTVDFSDLGRLARLIDRYLGRPGNRHPKLFISEWTIPTAPDQEFGAYVDPPVQAKWIAAALQIARGWSRIYTVGWIHLFDEPPVSYGGLLQTNGTMKPGYFAWKAG